MMRTMPTLLSSAGMSHPDLALHSSLESIPGVWASAFHDGIVWCNQLVVRVADMMLGVAREASKPAASQHSAGAEDRNSLVMSRVRSTLFGPYGCLHRNLMLAASQRAALDSCSAPSAAAQSSLTRGSSSGCGSEAAAGGRGVPLTLSEALTRAPTTKCTGPNLAWYLQYNTPRAVTTPLLHLKHSAIKVSQRSSARSMLLVVLIHDADAEPSRHHGFSAALDTQQHDPGKGLCGPVLCG